MKLLLDTHAWLWFHLGDPQLSQTARQHILDPANTKFISPASFWEISIKVSLGKYVLHVPYSQFMRDSIAGHGFGVLDITPRHTELVTTLPFPVVGGKEHRDPFRPAPDLGGPSRGHEHRQRRREIPRLRDSGHLVKAPRAPASPGGDHDLADTHMYAPCRACRDRAGCRDCSR